MVFANELQPLIRENFFREICHHASIRENIFREIRHFGDAESRKFLPRKFLLAKISSNKVGKTGRLRVLFDKNVF